MCQWCSQCCTSIGSLGRGESASEPGSEPRCAVPSDDEARRAIDIERHARGDRSARPCTSWRSPSCPRVPVAPHPRTASCSEYKTINRPRNRADSSRLLQDAGNFERPRRDLYPTTGANPHSSDGEGGGVAALPPLPCPSRAVRARARQGGVSQEQPERERGARPDVQERGPLRRPAAQR